MALPSSAQYRAELNQLRSELDLLDPRLAWAGSEFRTALYLRDVIASRAVREVPGIAYVPPPSETLWWPMGLWRYALDPASKGNRCGTLAVMFLHALNAFGIKARYVGMLWHYSYEQGAIETHASVDAFVDGAWVAMDPTYNFTPTDGVAKLSWEAARARLQANATVYFDDHTVGVRPDFHASVQNPGFRMLTTYMVSGPSEGDMVERIIGGWSGLMSPAPGQLFSYSYSMVGHDDQNPVDVTTLYEFIAANRNTTGAPKTGAWAA